MLDLFLSQFSILPPFLLLIKITKNKVQILEFDIFGTFLENLLTYYILLKGLNTIN